jgi:tetratricopeptide (TPR) repeat protein
MMNKKIIRVIFIIVFMLAAFNLSPAFGLLIISSALIYMIYRNLPTIFMFIGNKKYVSTNINEAMPWYERSYKYKHSKPMVVINYAYVLLKQGNLEKAHSVLNEVMKESLNERDRANAIINLSLILWKKDNLDEAVSILEELYSNGYKNTLLYQNLGFFYILTEDFNKALELNLEAYKYNSTDASILDNLAINYYFIKDYHKAVDIYEKLMLMRPSFVTAYYYYGLALEKQGRIKEAIETLEKALTYRFSFLSAVTREQVEKEIKRLKESI